MGTFCKVLNSAKGTWVLGEKVQVRALMTEATLQCENLDKITDADELAAGHKQQCEVNVPRAWMRLRKGPKDTQIVTIKLSMCEEAGIIVAGPDAIPLAS